MSVDTSPTNTTVFDKEFETVYLSLDLIDEPPWNPNEQDPGTFNALVANIKEVGFLDPILVCPRPDVPERYFSISGSHRVKAGRVAGATKIPAMIRTDFTEDMMRFQNMRFNIIKGKLDPLVLTAETVYDKAGTYQIAARVTDVFGNDGIAVVDVEVGR